MKSILLIALLSTTAWGAMHKFPNPRNIDPGDLRAKLEANGFSVVAISCSGGYCEIMLGATEKKNPKKFFDQAKTIDDQVADRKKNEAKILALAQKWRVGSISSEEKDELLKLFILRSLGIAP